MYLLSGCCILLKYALFRRVSSCQIEFNLPFRMDLSERKQPALPANKLLKAFADEVNKRLMDVGLRTEVDHQHKKMGIKFVAQETSSLERIQA